MINVLAQISETVQQGLEIPIEHLRNVAIVGAGSIVEVGHLPAYGANGVPVVGITDVNRERAEALAERYSIPKVYASYQDLIADPSVEVVDVAVPTEFGPSIVRAAIENGKHVLSQKPFALNPAEAQELADLAHTNGVLVVVNQQLRFDEGIAAAKAMVDAGWIGEVVSFRIDVDIKVDWTYWGWLINSDQLDLWYHSIHYMDAVRYFLGDPASVFCRATKMPGQAARGETRTTSLLLYPGEVQGTVQVNHENTAGDGRAGFRIDGTAGSIRGTLGILANYPNGGPDTVEIRSNVLPTDGWLSYPATSRWIPDAMIGPMASLLRGIATGSEPMTSGANNVGTVAIVAALYRSAASGQVEVPSR